MRLVFMGSSEFSVPALAALIDSADHDVIAVYTKMPKPAGRGYELTKTPVHVYAESCGIEVRTPAKLSAPGEEEVMAHYAPDAIIVASYGLMLPSWTIAAAPYGCVNIHPSLLPRWRGAAPMQHAILSGDQVTGVSIMQIVESMDAGDIYLQRRTEINEKENIIELSRRLSLMGSDMLMEVLGNIKSIVPIKQDEAQVTYAKKPTEFRIDFNDTAEVICRKIRALYPRVFFFLGNTRIRVLEADSYEFTGKQAAEIVDSARLHIKCGGNTVLAPKIVQQESRNPCDVSSFMCRFKGGVVPAVS
ncbi:methionyl-tRNA formyltransferase [Candidatus Anaplasma sp. TIGMIC]|uniref:methionyl-tRNA formyltransferase n=1 Tax=Candidatus Anaplasma sp. TIGMIC TaxID=3020713 RepID=UPI00233112AD|nr:methionyl-tRNA formyltransferase [Candidatus Anaplasma sp. TIGMIC]MDB1135044.1 methionyl-tRNA formyltransferase [Candidatus Anaplasma sp. TIGMIC]